MPSLLLQVTGRTLSPGCLPLVPQPQGALTLTQLVLKDSMEGSLLGARNLGFGLKLIVGGMQDNKK